MAELGLKIFDPPGPDGEWTTRYGPALADIVMVHGLNGGRITTWTQGQLCWPRDLLYEQIPRIRVMTFGYNADVLFSSSTSKVRDYSLKLLTDLRDKRESEEEANRPLIFICHSLGGIVAKKALVIASLDARYNMIANQCNGIIFFGTPHRGSSAATMGKVMLNIAKVSGSRPDLLAALEKNQDGLQEITEDFTRVVAKYTIKSFYESDKMFGIKKIVAKESATMNIPQEECIPIDGYHRDICRFSRDDDRFEAVWKAVKRMMVTQGTDISKKDADLSDTGRRFIEALPSHHIGTFLDSQEQPQTNSCDWIHGHNDFRQWLASSQVQVLHVVGEPGSGKSTLAAWLFDTSHSLFPGRQSFVFSFQSGGENFDASAAWSALISQHFYSDESFSTRIPGLLGADNRTPYWIRDVGSSSAFWTNTRLRDMFTSASLRSPNTGVIYILDALDACGETLPAFLRSLVKVLELGCHVKPKFLLLSRPILPSSIDAVFESAGGTLRIDMNADSHHVANVEQYITTKVDELCTLRPGMAKLRLEMVNQLKHRSSGIYLLPSLTLKSLAKSRATPANIRSALQELPGDLQTIYSHALEKVGISDRDKVSALLLWAVFGLRPLRVAELSAAITFCCEASDFEDASDLDDHISLDLLGDGGVCELVGPLIKATSDGVVSLVHSSAKEYLLKVAAEVLTGPGDHSYEWVWQSLQKVAKGESSDAMSRGSEILLSHCEALVSFAARTGIMATVGRAINPSLNNGAVGSLVQYAIENLPDHVRQIQWKDEDAASAVQFTTFLKSDAGHDWINCFWCLTDPSQQYKTLSPLQMCCALCLNNGVRLLGSSYPKGYLGLNDVDRLKDLETKTTELLGAVDIAAMFGNVEGLRVLCEDYKVPINCQNLIPTVSWKRTSGDSESNRIIDDLERKRNRLAGQLTSFRPLHTAILYGHADAVDYLVSRHSSVLIGDDDGLCALQLALEKNIMHVVPILLPHYEATMASVLPSFMAPEKLPQLTHLVNLQPNLLRHGIRSAHTESSYSALHLAARQGQLQAFTHLLELGALFDGTDINGRQPIHYAAAASQVKIVRHILDLNPDCLLSESDDGHNALYYGIYPTKCPGQSGTETLDLSQRKRIIDALLSYADESVRDLAIRSAFDSFLDGSVSAYWGTEERLQLFQDSIDYLSTIAHVTASPQSLHRAFASESFPLKSALDICPDPMELDDDGRTALHTAALAVHNWGVFHSELVGRMTNIDGRDHEGKTALHLVLEAGQKHGWRISKDEVLARVVTLLDGGADVHVRDNCGRTPLMTAVEQLVPSEGGTRGAGLLDGTLTTLLAHGASAKDLRPTAFTAVRALSPHNSLDAKSLLDAISNVPMSEWLETAIAAKDATSDMVLMFLEVGCREESLVTLVQSLPRNEFERLCNAVFEGQLTALAMPCREGQTDLYDDKRWPRSGHMPPELAKAATNGNVNCLKFFLAQMGGFIDTTDIRGQTLLSLAAEAGRLEAVTYLLSQGASPHVPDGRGRSALYWAAREGKSDVIEMLVDSGAELTMDDIQMASGHMEQSDLKKLFRLHYRCRQIRKRKEAGDKSLD